MSRRGTAQTQLKLGELGAVRATAYFDFGLGNDGKREAPSEFRVFPAGPFATTKGTFVFSERSAHSVMAWYEKRQLPLMGDYEHQTDEPAVGRPPVIARASITEMNPVVRPGSGGPELWVENVKWTKAAREMLEAGEYRFFSPTFLHDPETKEVLALLRVALTNDPAIDDLEPLVAASAADNTEEGDPTMADAVTCTKCAANESHLATMKEQFGALKAANDELLTQHKALSASHQELVGKHQELSGAHGAMLKSFEDWAAEEADEPEHQEETATATAKASLCAKRIASLRAFRKDVVALTGEKKSGAMLGKATAWKTGAGELATLKAEQEKAKLVQLTADFKSLTDKLVTEGKLTPAKRDEFVEKAKLRGTEHVMEFLTTAFGNAAPIVATTPTTPPSHETSMALATLSAGAQAEIAKLFPGLSVEQAAQSLQTWQKQMPKVMAARTE